MAGTNLGISRAAFDLHVQYIDLATPRQRDEKRNFQPRRSECVHDSWIEFDIFCEEWEQHKAN